MIEWFRLLFVKPTTLCTNTYFLSPGMYLRLGGATYKIIKIIDSMQVRVKRVPITFNKLDSRNYD